MKGLRGENAEKKVCLLVSVLMGVSFCAAGCHSVPSQSVDVDSVLSSSVSSELPTSDSSSSGSFNSESSGTSSDGDSRYLTNYSPKLFDKKVEESEESLCDGAILVKNTVCKSNDTVSIVYALEIDLSKTDIRAGTKDNATVGYKWEKAVPYAQAQAWEESTGGQVYAAINADFFGSTCVNAFVKDGIILKAGHNDNGNYNYLDDASDVPASAPMLFGIKDKTAQIAPVVGYSGDVTTAAVKQSIIQSKLAYTAYISGQPTGMLVVEGVKADAENLAFNTVTERTMRAGTALKVDVSKGYKNMEVLEKLTIASTTRMKPSVGKYAYLQADASNEKAATFLEKAEKGGVVSFSVTSEDGKWNGYDTVLGCRQALVLDGKIAETASLENTNGAQRQDVPRTAVGIKEDGTVVLFAVESLYYGNKSQSPSDGHGMSLPELAEFMYYYRCEQGANFDGGGSTQLTVRAEGEETGRVVIRSSDTASTDLLSTRAVMNSFLVTSKIQK